MPIIKSAGVLHFGSELRPDPPDGVFFDVAGSAHFFRGEAALIDDLINRLEGAGLSARAAVADTPGCAWAVTRFSKSKDRVRGPRL